MGSFAGPGTGGLTDRSLGEECLNTFCLFPVFPVLTHPPVLFEVMGTGPDRIWTSIQVVEEGEVGENRLDGNKIIVKHDPMDLIGVGKAHPLYFHCLHPFHLGNGLSLSFYREQPRDVSIHGLHRK